MLALSATLLQARDLCWQLLQQTCLDVCFSMSFTYLIIVPIPHYTILIIVSFFFSLYHFDWFPSLGFSHSAMFFFSLVVVGIDPRALHTWTTFQTYVPIHLYLYLFISYVCLRVNMWPWACGTCGGQNRVLASLELKLQVLVSHPVLVSETRQRSSGKCNVMVNVFNCRAISSGLIYVLSLGLTLRPYAY